MFRSLFLVSALAALLVLSLVVAARHLPGYMVGVLAIVEFLVVVLGLRRFGKRALNQIGKNLFETKSRVLRGARFELHSVQWVDRPFYDSQDPDLTDEQDDELENARWLEVDCTIEPQHQPTSPMSHWDPFDFVLAEYGTELSLTAANGDEPEGWLERVEGIEPPVATDDLDKIEGKARLLFVFGCPEALPDDVIVRYYFESLGRFTLPK
jgi:hypothetical protein